MRYEHLLRAAHGSMWTPMLSIPEHRERRRGRPRIDAPSQTSPEAEGKMKALSYNYLPL